MTEIRFHGRGGQGSVIASKILAEAAFREGMSIQSFPHFGIERRGAPVMAFTRIDKSRIRIRHQIYRPDGIVVLDPTLIEAVDVARGLKTGGFILLNTDRAPNSFLFKETSRIAVVDASRIAAEFGLGSRSAPIVNTAILGALAKFTGLVRLNSIIDAIIQTVPLKAQENAKAAEEAYKKIRIQKS